MGKPRVAIVTGLSGAGLTSALHTLQDSGFYCVDNLPIELLWDTIELIEAGKIPTDVGYAFGMDIRSAQFAKKFPTIKKDLAERVDLDVMYISAESSVLQSRYGTARRRHPAADLAKDLEGQIAKEELLLKPVAEAADIRLDTTHLKPRQLRALVESRCEKIVGRPLRTLQVTFVSFGFKYGTLTPVEELHDVRFLPNPYFEPELRSKTGLDPEVQSYVFNSPAGEEILNKLIDLYRFILPQYLSEGRHFLRVGLGCTGGQHRSVSMVERLAARLAKDTVPEIVISVAHRDLNR
ncbi:MAG: RNase adapter RapZ [bacterium]